MRLRDLRQEYGGHRSEVILDPDPIVAFGSWLQEAIDAGLREPNAMTLATASAAGRPSARIVLLKAYDQRGFVFATNYESRKARELEHNGWGSLVFCWLPLERQVRVEGEVVRSVAEESDRLHAERPRPAQIGAWASRQSAEIRGREELERRCREVAERFPTAVPRPPHWGGYRLLPARIEFWQGQPHRLHDRVQYDRPVGGGWTRRRLAP